MKHLFTSSLLLLFLTAFAWAQSTQLTYPPPGSNLIAGSNIIVQVGMGGYPESIEVLDIVIGLGTCLGGQCEPASAFMGDILYHGPYNPQPGLYYQNYTVTVPAGFATGLASLNVINFFLVGAENEPIVDYLNENVTIVNC